MLPNAVVENSFSLIAALVALVHIVGVLTSLHAIMSTRTAQGAIAWITTLITFPYAAVPAYWFFGRNKFHGYVLAKRRNLQRIEGLSQRARDEAGQDAVLSGISVEGLRGAEELARVPITTGNRVELLIDGEATFASILAGMDEAREYILIQFFIVRDDDLGRRIKAKLMERARAGVRVLFLYDEVGSRQLPTVYRQELRDAGVEVYPFGTGRGGFTNRFQLNFRNHRKIVVVDGRACWIGGHNIGDEYLGKNPEFGHWRDTHVRIDGPAAIAAQLVFVEDWHWATGALLAELNWDRGHAAVDAATPALIVPSGPADRFETAALMFTQAINGARKRLWIASPYFVPEPSLTTALQLAALRGVDVRILLPAKADHLLVWLAGYSFVDEVSASGAHFYGYEAGFLHQKVMLIDDRIAAVGTANFDNRSFRLNFEITSFFIDAELAVKVQTMFETDFAAARLMQPNDFAAKPAWFRLAARASRLMSPIL